ncbi:class I SAM-dependent methyltransferase [Christensenellaceae bacterium OttesenSCG-928-K19]|nr:class I SAM-dependent methyltransferase [Christensenellaceae bacterium OttesenSCG-928-K19]
MKENKYDDPVFFDKYAQMERSQKGLAGAGEWHEFKKLLPDFNGKRVLDLGCGLGWHCVYAAQHGAARVVGTDISQKMLEEARCKSADAGVTVEYLNIAIEDACFEEAAFDIVLSSLAFHYVASFAEICKNVYRLLSPGGDFVFSVEHPVFTAYGTGDWYYNENGAIMHWPVDRYFAQGKRQATFLDESVIKYHKTLTTYIDTLLQSGFSLRRVVEPEPDPILLEQHPEYGDELRRPMFLLLAAQKN